MQEVLVHESYGGSFRVSDNAWHVVAGHVIEVVAPAIIAKLREDGIDLDSGSGTAQVVTVTFTGTAGTARISVEGSPDFIVTFATDLTTTLSNFVTANSAAFATYGITLTSSGANLILTAAVAGIPFQNPRVQRDSGDLFGIDTITTKNVGSPLILHGLSGSLAAGEKIYAKTLFRGIQLTSGTVVVK